MTAGDDADTLVLRLLEAACLAAPVFVIPAAEVLATTFLVTFALEATLLVPDDLAPKVAAVLLAGIVSGD